MEVEDHYASYAAAVCELQLQQLDDELAVVQAAGARLNADSVEVRRAAALEMFASLTAGSSAFAEALGALVPPSDGAFQAVLLDGEAEHRKVLDQAGASTDTAETHEELDASFEAYVSWLEVGPGTADRAFAQATEDLQRAISVSPVCDELFD